MLVLRQVKGSPLTIAEEDGNFTYLEGLYEFIATNPSLLINGSNSMQADLKVGGNALLNVTRISDPLGASAIVLTSGERILAASDGTDFIYFDDRSLGIGIKNPGNKISRIKNTSTSDEVFLLPDKAGAGGTFAMLSDIASAGITALTGDVSASGSGSVVATLATVNSNIGTFNNVTVNAKGLVTAASNVSYEIQSNKGIANGYAGLDTSGYVPLSQINPSLIGAVEYQGAWNASTNSPSLATGTGIKGYYYVVSVAGTTTIDGVSSWAVGDWIVYDGTRWDKINNVQGITTVSGVNTNGFTWTIANPTTTPTITLQLQNADASHDGKLIQTDWTAFNNKQAALNGTGFVKSTAGTISYDTNTYAVSATTLAGYGITDAYTKTASDGRFAPIATVSSQWVTTASDVYYSAGNVMIGNASAPLTKLHVVETSTSTLRGLLFGQYSTDSLSSKVTTRKARGTYASPTSIVVADVLSNWATAAYDGTNFIDCASIRTTSVGIIGTGRTPTKIELMTMTDVTTGVLTTALTLDQNQKATFANTVELTSISLLDTTYKSAFSVLSANNLLLGGSGWTNNIYGDINLRDSAATYRQLFTGGNNTFTMGSGFNSMSIAAYASFTKTITFTSSDISSINVSALINSTAGSFIASAYRWTSGINQTGGTGIIAGLCLTPSVSAVFTGSTLAGIYSNIATIAPGSGTAYFINHIGSAASLFSGTITSKGFADASNASVGNVGEIMESTISTFANYTTSATYQNITSITLTAGDWDIYAFGTFSSNSATITAGANTIFNIATATASATGAIEGKTISYIPQSALIGTSIESCGSMRIRVSISATTIYYLNTQATFTLLNPQFTGSISARRIR